MVAFNKKAPVLLILPLVGSTTGVPRSHSTHTMLSTVALLATAALGQGDGQADLVTKLEHADKKLVTGLIKMTGAAEDASFDASL